MIPSIKRRLGLSAPRLLDALFAALAIAALIRVFRDSEAYDEDFHVYWKAAHTWLSGGNPYAFTPEDHGFVFKYPPWILPLFIPLGAMSWEGARHAWFATECFCIFFAIRWCTRQGVSARIASFVAFLFWWMFHAHFAAGQFTLILLTACLMAWPADIRPTDPAILKQGNGFREGALAFMLSAKVFSLFTLGGIWKRFLRLSPWLWILALLAVSHGLLLLIPWQNGQWEFSSQQAVQALVAYYRDFMAAAASGGSELGAEIVRGQGNHGLTALVLRSLNVNSLSFASDMTTSAILALILGTLWNRYSKPLTEAERWAGWIGIGLVVHPLAWHHSFVLAYPLCALAVSRALKAKQRDLFALALLGTCCIGIFIPQVLGKTLVKPIELAGVKSWGVILSAASLALSARRGETRT